MIQETDKKVKELIGVKKRLQQYTYKKLDLAGHEPKAFDGKHFESISQETFDKTINKHLLRLESLKLSCKNRHQCLGGVVAKLSDGNVSRCGTKNLDPNCHYTVNMKGKSLSEI